MPKPMHSKQTLSGSKAVSQCLTYETPPPTPPKMQKFRKKHNQVPGIKVVHHGLIDQVLPPASHVYGVKLSDNNPKTAPAQTAVNKMFSEGHSTELGKYIQSQNEVHYKRHKQQPLGKACDRGYTLPQFTNEDDFAFGVASEKASSGSKELIEINPNAKIPQTFSRMPLTESIAAQKEIVCKRNYNYDWNALHIDPTTNVFGKQPKQIDDDADKRDSVANSLKFVGDAAAWDMPLNEKRTKPMPEEHIYGIVNAKDSESTEWGVKECVHSDVEENRRVARQGHLKYFEKIYGNQTHIISRLDPKRVSAKALLNPSNTEMKVHREMDEIVQCCADAGYPVKQEYISKVKAMLDEKYDGDRKSVV